MPARDAIAEDLPNPPIDITAKYPADHLHTPVLRSNVAPLARVDIPVVTLMLFTLAIAGNSGARQEL